MIIFLALLFTTVDSLPTDKLEEEEQIAETSYVKERAISQEAIQLRKSIQRELSEYDCSRGDDVDCAAWKAEDMLDDLELGQVNCDEDHPIQTELCDKARDQADMCDKARDQTDMCDKAKDQIKMCDKARDQAEMCDKARDLLGDDDKNMSYEEIKKGLLADVEEIFDDEHDKYLNPIWYSISDYVCFKEPASCEILSEMMADLMKFEDVVKHENGKKKQ